VSLALQEDHAEAAPVANGDSAVASDLGESGAHAATTDEAAEGWALLDGLRRRMDEQVAQTRTIAAQVGTLAESLAALVHAERRRTRWLNINSFVAYVLFTLLCAGGFYWLYQTRARELVNEADRAGRERDAAARRADDATARTTARDAIDAKLLETYRLLESGRRADAQKRIAELAAAPLSAFDRAVLDDRARAADAALVDNAIKSAQAAFKAGRAAEAVAPLEAALAIAGGGSRAGELHYLLGVAKAKLGELEPAARELRAALAADVGEEDTRFRLAEVLERANQNSAARVEYEKFANAHPQSPYAMYAARRAAMLARLPAPGQPAPRPAPAPAPGPTPTPAPAPTPTPAPAPPDKPAE
jgi:tetratricopeptide (TPR) repeat protein